MVGRMAGRQTAGLGERGDRVRPAARSFAQQVGSGSGGKWEVARWGHGGLLDTWL